LTPRESIKRLPKQPVIPRVEDRPRSGARSRALSRDLIAHAWQDLAHRGLTHLQHVRNFPLRPPAHMQIPRTLCSIVGDRRWLKPVFSAAPAT
jgi:hypothetical protein